MFGENLKNARKNKKLSQEEVAEIINTARSNISKYENNQLEPNLETLKLLCQLYEVSSDSILDISNSIDKSHTTKEIKYIEKTKEIKIKEKK